MSKNCYECNTIFDIRLPLLAPQKFRQERAESAPLAQTEPTPSEFPCFSATGVAAMLIRSSRLFPRLQAACLRAVPHVQKLSTAVRKLSTVVRVEDDEQSGVKVLTLDRPDSLNAMTVEMGDAVQASVAQLSQLPPSELRALVITGAGRAFSAGGDMRFLHERREATPTDNADVMLNFYRRFLSIRSLPVPIICCVNGPAIGAGACFAMAADVRFTHAAAKIGFTFVGLGLHPGMGATHSLPSAVGPQVHARSHAACQRRPAARLAGHQPHVARAALSPWLPYPWP